MLLIALFPRDTGIARPKVSFKTVKDIFLTGCIYDEIGQRLVLVRNSTSIIWLVIPCNPLLSSNLARNIDKRETMNVYQIVQGFRRHHCLCGREHENCPMLSLKYLNITFVVAGSPKVTINEALTPI